MKPSAALVTFAALTIPMLSACAAPSHQPDARDLREQVAALPGVSRATLKYSEPITLDSGKVVLKVAMAPSADAAQIARVVTTTYAAFADVHHDEEGDLDVTIGEDLIHLRSFEPDAEIGAVEDATAQAIAVLPSGAIRADLTTQEVPTAPYVSTTFTATVKKPGRDAILTTLTKLKAAHQDIPNAGWRVQNDAQRGWLISSVEGFPGTDEVTLFEDLSKNLPAGATVLLYDDDFATVQVTSTTSPATASAIFGRSVALLGGPSKGSLDLQRGQRLLASTTTGDCFFGTGPIGAQVERDHRADCTTLAHPEP